MKNSLRSLSVFTILFFLSFRGAYANLEDVFKKWTYTQDIKGVKVDVSYVSNDLINEWLKHEKSQTIIERVNALRKSIDTHGYYVYVVHLKLGKTYKISINTVKNNVKLNVTEKTQRDYYPVAYSGNLNAEMSPKRDYYGVIVFNTPFDEYSFQALSVDMLMTNVKYNEVCLGRGATCRSNRVCCKHKETLQFAFLPTGVPNKNQPSSANLNDILGILKVAVQIIKLLRV